MDNMARPVWKNEIIGDINGDFDPRYDIAVDGEIVLEGAKLKLRNPITTEGTNHNADNMNNLFDIDNMDSMKANTKQTVFNADGSITEEIRDKSTNVLNAARVTTFPANGNIVETTTVYTDDGKFILRQTVITTSFSGTSTIKEEVN